ncbi:hypothetical protein BST97_14545 [Nonlabens spongiae]|uniref:Uncharacterized protein n=1 Tax=Nonlabens spongiae TaxID=331648 RepID=A0A1W6MPL4_9FLAO|nr:hypothetical protein [Nonlabens spongiae]ARN79502.1 hypothetical protein BST97_14545 [Nonlabens spongiae]
MNIEKVKEQLALRVQEIMVKRKKHKIQNLTSFDIKMSWKEKVADTEDLVQRIYHTLNELITQNQILFATDSEKEDFVDHIEPTIYDLVIRNIDD